jgi:tagatose 6-phosphate kinase
MSKVYNQDGKYILVVCPNPSVDIYAWIDTINTGAANRIIKEEHYAGGKGVHVALALAEMKKKVKLLGFWGGPTGQWITEQCEKYPTLNCVGPKVAGWSRSCYTFKAETDFDDTELLGVGPILNEENVQAFYALYDSLVGEANCVVLSGSWPKGAPEDGYARLIRKAQEFEKASVLDCTGAQFKNAIEEFPYLVHLNKSESVSIFGGTDAKTASEKLALHCEYAAITDGANGLYLTKEQRTTHASCPIDNVYSSVGSGDCLTAGLTAAIVEAYNIQDMAKLGVACGAANCLRKELGYLNNHDVEVLYGKTLVKELEYI